ncbi:MAG: hypothetical protein VR64_00240 [Desulfatitalea sp. BRH_c12]|nr:MAG: hypothetical protein VR64_00240 [Desulfatitalea sp. BRH_c12]
MKSRIFIILFFALACASLGQGLVVPLLPGYAFSLGASGFLIGVIFGAFSLSRTLFQPVFGNWSDAIGRKPFIALGLFGSFIASLAYIYAKNAYALILIRFFQGAVSAMVIPVAQAYAGEITPKGKEGARMGVLNLSMWIGLAGGPIIGGGIKDWLTIEAAFLSMGLVCFAGFLMSWGLLPQVDVERDLSPKRSRKRFGSLIKNPQIAAMFIFRLTHGMCIGIVWSFAPLIADVIFKLSGFTIGMMITSGMVAGGLVMPVSGILADKVRKGFLIGLGGCVIAIGMLLLSNVDHVRDFYMASILLGIGGGIALPPVMATTVLIGLDKSAMGAAMSLIATADSLGMMIGPILGGVAMDTLSREAAFRGGSVLMTAVTVLLVVCFRKASHSEIGDECQVGRIKVMK